MDNKKLLNAAMAALLAFGLTLGAIGCMVTGFNLEAAMAAAAFACAIGALLGAVCGGFRVGALPAGLIALLCGYLWHKGFLAVSLESLLYRISVQYDSGYGCGVFYWSDMPPGGNMTLALCLYGALAASLLSWFLVKGWTPLLPGFLAVLPVIASMVLIDTVPKESWLFAVLLALCLILLTQSARGKNGDQAGRLTALLLIPVAAALTVLFLLVPQEGYDRQAGAQALEDWVMQWFESPFEEVAQEVFAPSSTADEQVNLRTVGPQQYQMNIVMEVTAQETGPIYLRGQVYDSYDGLSWSAAADSDIPQFSVTHRSMELTVKTRYTQRLLYLPYVSYHPLAEGMVENTEKRKEYTVTYTPLIGYNSAWDSTYIEIPEALEPFLQLPEQTQRRAGQWLPAMESASAGGVWRYAQAVKALVSGSASYNLYTKRMPSGETDFALWFLEESDTGYCIHFASAAAVLLRAAGIPTRYVTGYLVDARAGETVQVHQKDAHAWVEYYIPGIGWQVLEATPSGGTSPVPPETTEATDPSQIAPTAPATQPQASQPPQATKPPVQQPSERPSVSDTATPETPEEREIPAWLKAVLWVLLIAAAISAQWQLRLWLRRMRFSRGTANTRALMRFREIRRHCRIRGNQPERDILFLAQKAKFSQHTVTEAELARLDGWLENSKKEFRSQKLWLQPVYTLILALY